MGKRKLKNITPGNSKIDNDLFNNVQSTDASASFMAAEIGTSAQILDLHGYDRHTALRLLDQFLNQAVMENADYARIIHGAGSGVLRQAVQAHLASHSLVKEFRPASYPHETAITIVLFEKLK